MAVDRTGERWYAVRVQRVVWRDPSLAKRIDGIVSDPGHWLGRVAFDTGFSIRNIMHKPNPSALAALTLILKPDLHSARRNGNIAGKLTFASKVFSMGLCGVGIALKFKQKNPQCRCRHSGSRRVVICPGATLLAIRGHVRCNQYSHLGTH